MIDIVFGKLAIGIACTALIIPAIRQRARIEDFFFGLSIPKAVGGLWLLFRLLPYLLVFIILGIEPTSDVNGFWYMASHAAEGKVVYRDFWSPYSPFYSYLLGIGALIWSNPKVIVLTMIILEGCAVLVSYPFFKQYLTKSSFLFKALIYFLMPGSLVLCVLGAQEDIWMWLFFTLGVYAGRSRGSVVVFSLILALGVLTTKAIFVLFLLPLFLIENDKISFTWPLTAVGLTSLVILYQMVGMEFLQPIGEADTLRAPNIVSVLNPITYNRIGMGKSFWNWIGLALTVGLGVFSTYKGRNDSYEISTTRVFIVMYATLMIVQQSAYSNYLFIFLLPLVLILTDFRDRKFLSFLLFYNILCTVHPSLWWRSGMPKYYSPSDIFANALALTDYLMQAGIVGMTIYLICYTLRAKEAAIKRMI